MAKFIIVYTSLTGNTESMANGFAEGIKMLVSKSQRKSLIVWILPF